MSKPSIYTLIERQYKAFVRKWYAIEDKHKVGEATDAEIAKDYELFWDEWFVCKAADLPQFTHLNMHVNERGTPIVYVSFDDPVMDDRFAELKLEDLIANCWNGWRSQAATDERIEANLRKAFEAGIKKARKREFA